MRQIVINRLIRTTKCLLMLAAIIAMAWAYQLDQSTLTFYDNGSNTYDRLVSVYCVIITGLVYWEYHTDQWLRIFTLVAFLGCINMTLDEFIFNPIEAGINEEFSAVLILLATIFNGFRIGLSKPPTP